MTAFHKYHGLGNDFVLIDNRNSSSPVLTPSQSVDFCARHTGVGADGVIFLLPPTNATSDFGMRLHNADGSEPEMCGNGIRCLARFAADLNMKGSIPGRYVVDTPAGEIIPELLDDMVRVDMGIPILEPSLIPTTLNSNAQNNYQDVIMVNNRKWTFCPVSMGNPHGITFVSKELYDEMDAKLEEEGPLFESHQVFPQKANIEFVHQRSRTEFDMLVWERGSGRTMACGTGACAVVVAAILTSHAERNVPIVVHLPGGDLTIEWAANGHVFMTGPAEPIFEGRSSLGT